MCAIQDGDPEIEENVEEHKPSLRLSAGEQSDPGSLPQPSTSKKWDTKPWHWKVCPTGVKLVVSCIIIVTCAVKAHCR